MVEKLEHVDPLTNESYDYVTVDEGQFLETLSMAASLEIPAFIARLQETTEKAPSIPIQAEQIREAYLNISDAGYENWKDLMPEQRLAVLNALEAETAGISMREPLQVVARELPVSGQCKDGQIIISDQLLLDSSKECYLKAMEALFHEGRHAYQMYNMYTCQVEQSTELVKAWRLNMNLGYDDGVKSKWFGRSEEQREIQAREVDADAFTMEVMKCLELDR